MKRNFVCKVLYGFFFFSIIIYIIHTVKTELTSADEVNCDGVESCRKRSEGNDTTSVTI